MQGVSITVITQTWNADNWPGLVAEYKRSAMKNGRLPLKSCLCAAYLQMVGKLLWMRDRLSRR